MLKIGLGYDTHALVAGRKLILGGVEIPYALGLEGHSDADVLTHALMDALLGAAGLPDIGNFFPDDDPSFQGAKSLILLQHVLQHVRKKHAVLNADTVILCQRPKLRTYIPEMMTKLSKLVEAPVNVKATTTEKMNAEGEGRCISVQAIALLDSRP